MPCRRNLRSVVILKRRQGWSNSGTAKSEKSLIGLVARRRHRKPPFRRAFYRGSSRWAVWHGAQCVAIRKTKGGRKNR